MSRKRSILHSTERHNNRNYKRRIRNLFFEIAFIIVLTFVAIKFIKKDDQMPKVSGLTVEEQKQIIDEEMNQESKNQESEEKEIKAPNENGQELKITKATIKYDEKSNQTILKLNIKNYSTKTVDSTFKISLIDYTEKKLVETYIDINRLNANSETRLNTVLDGDLRNVEKIEIIDEK